MLKKDAITLVAAPLRKQVIELLRKAIISWEYEPGVRLVEKDLCERFGVSRTVIREALRHLEAEGLVALVPNQGPVVSSTSPEEARCLYEVREVLEALAARRCAERATSDQKEKLDQALGDVAAAYKEGDLAAQLEAKDEFYHWLCQGSHNAIIASTLQGINARVRLLMGLSLSAPGRTDMSLDELERVVAAIQRGDGEAAGTFAAEHVRKAASTALSRLKDEQRVVP